MKLTAIPVLEENYSEKTFEIDISHQNPHEFVNLLDQYKALILQQRPTSTTATNTTTTQDDDIESQPPLLSVNDFGQFLVDLQLEYYPYIGGAAPRTIIPVDASPDPIVFTANERYVKNITT
jgi:hypothetical protein